MLNLRLANNGQRVSYLHLCLLCSIISFTGNNGKGGCGGTLLHNCYKQQCLGSQEDHLL